MRVVLDTNVLVSAFVFPGGAPEQVYRLVLAGELDLVTSRPLLLELGRVLIEKFGWETGYGEEVIAQLARVGEVVEPREEVAVFEEDPADNRVLEAALAGRVDVIISGGRRLRQLRSWQGIVIQDPAAFLEARH